MEDRLRILTMVKEGTLSVEEAAKLLDALETEKGRRRPPDRVLRVRIQSPGGRDMNMNVPLQMVDMVMPFLPEGIRMKTPEGKEVIDLRSMLRQVLESDVSGKIFDLAAPGGRRIEITVD